MGGHWRGWLSQLACLAGLFDLLAGAKALVLT